MDDGVLSVACGVVAVSRSDDWRPEGREAASPIDERVLVLTLVVAGPLSALVGAIVVLADLPRYGWGALAAVLLGGVALSAAFLLVGFRAIDRL